MIIDTAEEFVQTFNKYSEHISPKSLSEFLKCPLSEAREMCIHLLGYCINTELYDYHLDVPDEIKERYDNE